MRAYSLTELFKLTRAELFALHARIVNEMTEEAADPAAYEMALHNLRGIRQALSRSGRYAEPIAALG